MAGPTLLLATSNPGKRTEFAALLPSDVRVITLDQAGLESPPESGATFAENAILKASAAARSSGLLSVADDSGLEVDALAGAPGIHSARYAGELPSEANNRRKLLEALAGRPREDRWAQFRCVVAIADADGRIATAEGSCHGQIGFEEVGENGFGYDSLFLLPDGRTMAQLSLNEKNRVSHRARAYAAILPVLMDRLREFDAGGTK